MSKPPSGPRYPLLKIRLETFDIDMVYHMPHYQSKGESFKARLPARLSFTRFGGGGELRSSGGVGRVSLMLAAFSPLPYLHCPCSVFHPLSTPGFPLRRQRPKTSSARLQRQLVCPGEDFE